MDILFEDHKFEKQCNELNQLQRTFGQQQAKKIRQRLDQLHAADFLSDISSLPPPRLHQLVGDRDEQFSVDLVHPYRLIFTVANNPIPRKTDHGIDLSQVTAILIHGVEDTHE